MNHDSYPACPDGVRRGFPVETPLGTMYLRHVGWGVLVDNSSNTIPHVEGRPYLTVNGKQFTASVGVYDGGRIERHYVNKRGGGEAAPSYAEQIIKEARAAALQWIEEHPEHVAAGEHYRARMDVLSAEAQVERLKPEYETATKNLRAARKRLATAESKLKEVSC